MDAMEFFEKSAGKWRSQRTTHHLAFRRAEMGDLEIAVETLGPQADRVVKICEYHDIDPTLAVGGALVIWEGSMAWDREGEGHSSETVFAIVPDPDNPKKGRMLREKGYAETVPVAGRYEMDDDDGLVLITEYETMSARERFWFVNPNLRLRSSTVKRFGGFNTASFCSETRIDSENGENGSAHPDSAPTPTVATAPKATAPQFSSLLGW